MENLQARLDGYNLCDPEDMDGLLKLADLVRELLARGDYPEVGVVLNYCISNAYLEAFSWTLELLQESFECGDCSVQSYVCELGGQIPCYDGVIERLKTERRACKNEVETVMDQHGEVQSFFNVLTYKTGYDHIYLISRENFDTKDNDFIRYQLLFEK